MSLSDPVPEADATEPVAEEPQAEQKVTRFDQYNQPHPDGEKEFYCPGCGRRYEYRRECTGSAEAPHSPIEVIPTAELQGDEHTAAP